MEETIEELTFKALCQAQKSFDRYLEDLGNDPAYWDIRFTAWMRDSATLERYKRVEIESEVGGNNE